MEINKHGSVESGVFDFIVLNSILLNNGVHTCPCGKPGKVWGFIPNLLYIYGPWMRLQKKFPPMNLGFHLNFGIFSGWSTSLDSYSCCQKSLDSIENHSSVSFLLLKRTVDWLCSCKPEKIWNAVFRQFRAYFEFLLMNELFSGREGGHYLNSGDEIPMGSDVEILIRVNSICTYIWQE